MSRERGHLRSFTLLGLELQGRQKDVCLVSLERVVKTVSLQTTGTDQEFGGWDEKKVSLTYFSSIVTNPLAASREGLKFCVSAGGMEFGRNKQK